MGLEIQCLDILWDKYIVHAEGYLMTRAEAYFERLSIQKLICYPLFPLYGNGLPFCMKPHIPNVLHILLKCSLNFVFFSEGFVFKTGCLKSPWKEKHRICLEILKYNLK